MIIKMCLEKLFRLPFSGYCSCSEIVIEQEKELECAS